jgi:hypothetical protein
MWGSRASLSSSQVIFIAAHHQGEGPPPDAVLLRTVEHEEGEREQVGLARELEAAREGDGPRLHALRRSKGT